MSATNPEHPATCGCSQCYYGEKMAKRALHGDVDHASPAPEPRCVRCGHLQSEHGGLTGYCWHEEEAQRGARCQCPTFQWPTPSSSPAPEPPSAGGEQTKSDVALTALRIAALTPCRASLDHMQAEALLARFDGLVLAAQVLKRERDALAADAKRLREIAGTLIRTWQDGSLNSIAYDDLIDTCATRLAEMDRRAAAMPRAERGAEPMP